MAGKHKIGRNDPCPCGSGKKYKRCHGAENPSLGVPPIGMEEKAKEIMERLRARELQREKQQGRGRPIISTVHNGVRVVAVGNGVHWSEKWKTFHDFLGDYIRFVLGKEWGDAELKKPLSDRHPVCVWYHHVCQLQQNTMKEAGEVYSFPMTGAAAAWFSLAYDLYSLAHNIKIQAKLVQRLKNPEGFHGARYEVFVAATLIRAGFDIEFEDEDNRNSTHCEFTATYKASGHKYSVEAKQRDPGDQAGERSWKFHVGRRLIRALRKAAKYPRIVFIETSVPDKATDEQIPRFLEKALQDIRQFEGRVINGEPLPPAYVFLTNRPFEYSLEGTAIRTIALGEGFEISDFKMGKAFPSIRDAYEARKAHTDIHELLHSIRDHSEIPSTFDGEAPELAFRESPAPRLIIGETYLVPDGHGGETSGKLTTATMDVNRGIAWGAYLLQDGRSVIVTNKVSEAELAAYKRHPDTFFGVPLRQGRTAKTPLDLFDFILEAYSGASRDRLLENLRDAPDIEELRKLPREELTIIHAERFTNAALMQTGSSQIPPASP